MKRMPPACGVSQILRHTLRTPFIEYVVAGKRDAVNPAKTGTKAAAHYVLDIAGGR